MIYILIFLVIFFSAFYYDINGNEKRKWFVFCAILLVLILVSSLRYRIGADTVVYEYYYRRYPDLNHLTWDKLFNEQQEPLWVLLNSICKSFFGQFFMVQLFVSLFHISTWGWFVKKTCPSVPFLMLLFFYLFEFTHMDMVLMREAVSLSFFFIMIYFLNKNKYLPVVFCAVLGFMFHKFSILVFVSVLLVNFFYKRSPRAMVMIMLFVAIFVVARIELIQEELGYYFLSTDTIYNNNMMRYLGKETYSESRLNWKGILGLYMVAVLYTFIVYKLKKHKQMILIERDLLVSIILIANAVILFKSAFPIIYRVYDYFQTFTSMIVVTCFLSYVKRFHLKFLYYLGLLIIPLWTCYKIYFGPWVGNDSPNVYDYMEFYPYSSVLDPQKDPQRERGILNYAFD